MPLASALAAMLALASATSLAAPRAKITHVPGLDVSGQQGFSDYLHAPQHRAFAISAGGYWTWQAEHTSAEGAVEAALRACSDMADQPCVPYAVNERIVFDAARWQQQWRPYLSDLAATRAVTGSGKGQRFHDLKFSDQHGKVMHVSDLRGSVVILHFWGAWCPTCRTVLPDLARLQRKLSRDKAMRLILLQVREPFQKGSEWTASQGLRLPLFDSGVKTGQDDSLSLRNGTVLKDRLIAPVFPSTYVLDTRGIVVFSHIGSLPDWPAYLPLLQDVADHSGK
ncbi:MAG: TlpA family protein disulfide reductase [Gammaproteobacteria bacterium]|nr:TlpA family protein disulfide reductase [Gammaproteobacteria bacterium]